MESDEILAHVDRSVGFLTLNRPKAINSLTHAMVTEMHKTLIAWEHDDEVVELALDPEL